MCDDCKYKDICKFVDSAAVAKINSKVEGLPLEIVCTKKVVEESKQVDIQRL